MWKGTKVYFHNMDLLKEIVDNTVKTLGKNLCKDKE
jgi:hypothetical protein